MLYTLRTSAMLCVACLLSFCAATASAQQSSLSDFAADHPLTRFSAASDVQAQAPFVLKKFRMEFLADPGPPPAYTPFFETTRSYENGRVSEEITQAPDFMSDPPTLQNSSRTTFSYQSGHLSMQTSYSWDGSAWVESSRTTYTYDGAGQNTGTLEETYDTGTSSWRNETRSTITFSGGIPSEFLDEEWNGTAWVPTDRGIISEDNGDAVLIDQTWDGTAWVNDYRTLYTNSVEEIWQLQRAFGDLLAFEFFTFVPDRAMAEAVYALEYTEQSWDGTAWVNDNRTRITSSTAASLQAVEEAWDSVGSGWVITDRITLSFTGNRLDEMFIEEAPDSTLVPLTKTTYTYDGNGNPELLESFGDDDGDGTIDTQANMRILMDWIDLTGTAVGGETPTALTSLTGVQPNPAADATEVQFYLATPGPVLVQVFDALGREVATLASGALEAGTHTARLDVSSLTAGVYFVRLEAAGISETRSLVVAR